jgi:large conductance mechanosensitive channel
MLKGFREFVLRGNVIDLAVAVVIGAAFTAVINAIVTAVINPAIGALFNAEDLATALPVDIPTVSGGTATMYFGAVIAALIQFLIVAAVVYFALVLPVNKLRERQAARRALGEEEDTPPTELDLLAEIRDLLAADTAPSEHKH